MTRIKIITSDKYQLTAHHFIPKGASERVVIINSATGVKQSFYTSFAEYLTCRGFHVYTYDYRGIGESRYGSLKEFDASLMHWGDLDQSAVIRYIRKRHPSGTVTIVGHSIGGQFIGASSHTSDIDSFVMVASQTPYWPNYRGFMKLRVWALWHLIIPSLTSTCKFLPARRLGLFEDLPKQAADQWASWGKNKNYLFTEFPEKKKYFESLTQPALAFSFSDDEFAPPDAVSDLLQYYPGLNLEHRHITPEQAGVKSLGHFTFFRKGMKDLLWSEVADWILTSRQEQRKKCA